jgi:hypothetical protein
MLNSKSTAASHIIISGSTPAAPQSEATDLPAIVEPQIPACLAHIPAIKGLSVSEALNAARLKHEDILADWRYWRMRADNQRELDRCAAQENYILDVIDILDGALDGWCAPLPAALAAIEREEIAPDFEPVEAPESQSLPLATNGKHTHEWSKGNRALRKTMKDFGMMPSVELEPQRLKRMACVSTWINRTITSFEFLTEREQEMVIDAIRRGDILPGWEIGTEAIYQQEAA